MEASGPRQDAQGSGDEGGPRRPGSLALVKPRVLLLLVFAGLTGFLLAAADHEATLEDLAWLLAGGVLSTASANVFNNILDRDRDSLMDRTMWRPIPAGLVGPRVAAALGAVLGVAGLAILYLTLNPLTAALTLAGMLYYILVYTLVLKMRTAENITLGGIAGAFPPLVGWVAVTGQLHWVPLAVGLLIVLWTPPHFWSLALFHQEDYRRAGVPMLPVVRGERATQVRIVAYSVAMVVVSTVFLLGEGFGFVYAAGLFLLDPPFVYLAVCLLREGTEAIARSVFVYSNVYLWMLPLFLILDRHVAVLEG